MKKDYSSPEIELVRFDLATAVLDTLHASIGENTGSGGGGHSGEVPSDPGEGLDF